MRRQLSKSSSSSSFFFSFFFLRALFRLLFSSVPIKLVRLKQGTLTRPPPRASKQQRACAPVRRSRSAARATPRRAEGGVTLGRTKARLFLSQRRRSHFFDVVESLAFLFQSHSLSLISTESLTLLSPPHFSQRRTSQRSIHQGRARDERGIVRHERRGSIGDERQRRRRRQRQRRPRRQRQRRAPRPPRQRRKQVLQDAAAEGSPRGGVQECVSS